MDRRTFLTAAGTSAVRILGANDRLRAGVIGSGARGQYLIGEFKEAGAEVAAVCDVYEPRLNEGLALASPGAKAYSDYHRLLEDKSLDFVIIATPDHWHVQMVVDAVDAGKDIYIEKPLALTVEDGFRAVEAVRRAKRVCQVGSQRRSSDLFMEARRIMASGAVGEVRLVNSWWLNYVARLPDKQLEGKLDWQQWLGPAPRRDLDLKRFFGWHWYYDYGQGYIAQAAHIIDAINMIMGSSEPEAVGCMAGKVNVDGAEIPETASMTVQYPENFLAVFTVGYKAMRYAMYNDQLKQFHGTKARFDVGREFFALYPQTDAIEIRPSLDVKRPGSFSKATQLHVRNFLECMRSRNDPTATIETGQATSMALAMAVQSMRSGHQVRWNAAAKKVEEA